MAATRLSTKHVSFIRKTLSELLVTSPSYQIRSVSHAAKQTKTYRPIINSVNTDDHFYKDTVHRNKQLEEQYLLLLKAAKSGGGPKGMERHVKQNKKIFVWDRIVKLLDDMNSFIELASIAGHDMPYGNIAGASVVTGIGMIHNRPCMVIANDGTVKGGTVFPISLKKQLRAQQIAQELLLPCVYLVDSGGAFLPLQAEIFIEGGKTFCNEAVMSSLGIPQLALVCGNCTAGGAYVPTMADEAVMVDKIGTIFLGGPPLVKAATGEIITSEELGGATLHSKVSGCVDHFASNEDEAFAICRDIVLSLQLPDCSSRDCFAEPLLNEEELLGLASNTNYDAHQVIARITDGSGFQEFKEKFGPSLVTGFAHVCGYNVGIIANNAKTVCSQASDKAAHFVQLCTQRRTPILFLQNMADGMSQDAEVNGQVLKSQAKFMTAVACSNIPKMTIITGKYQGFSSYAMGSKAFGANIVFNWPSSSVCMTDSEEMVSSITSTLKEDPEKMAKTISHAEKQTSSVYAAANVWTDGIILPQDTRKVVHKCLQLFDYSLILRNMPPIDQLEPNFRM